MIWFNFLIRVKLTDGQYRLESMTFADAEHPTRPLTVIGEYSFYDDVNKGVVNVTYTAGVEGFRAHVQFPAVPPKIKTRILKPVKLQSDDELGCALRNSLCG